MMKRTTIKNLRIIGIISLLLSTQMSQTKIVPTREARPIGLKIWENEGNKNLITSAFASWG